MVLAKLQTTPADRIHVYDFDGIIGHRYAIYKDDTETIILERYHLSRSLLLLNKCC
jgi:hypothetical protein